MLETTNAQGLGRQITDKQRIKAAFAMLRELGFVCKMNYMCCQNCAKSQIHHDHPGVENVVTYNHQSNEYAFPHGAVNLHNDLVLHWNGDGEQIQKALVAAGLSVEWNGSPNLGIVVKKVQ